MCLNVFCYCRKGEIWKKKKKKKKKKHEKKGRINPRGVSEISEQFNI